MARKKISQFTGQDLLISLSIIGIVLLVTYWKITRFDLRGRATLTSVKAFPQAEGFGSDTQGGRFGKVIEVTNLNDSGSGSFRDAVEVQSGPRIVVFRVSGHIVLTAPVKVKNPYITIAAQTAPGDGILLRKEHLIIATHDVIVRNLRVRVGDEAGFTNNRDGITMSTTYATSDVYNVILDHCSVSWGIDENISTWISSSKTYKVHDIGIQWSIIAEGLNNSVHVDEGAAPGVTDPHSMGVLLAQSGAYNMSMHHNLLAHNKGRNPRIDGVKQAEVINNVFYNWGDTPTEIASAMTTAHIIGNYYKNGSNSSEREVRISDTMHADSRLYIENNYMDSYKDISLNSYKTRYPTNDQHAIILEQRTNLIQSWYTDNPPYYRSITPMFASDVRAISAQDAYNNVLALAGSYPKDTVDKRIIQETTNRTGSVIDTQNQVGGWPVYASGTAPIDTDHDGMPDTWETTHGLNPNDANDRNSLACNGYTQIEEYMNSLIPLPYPALDVPCNVSPTITPTGNPSPTPGPTRTTTPTSPPSSGIDTTPPTVTITQPQGGARLSSKGNQKITVRAADTNGIAMIDIIVDGTRKIRCTNSSSCTTNLKLNNLASGTHTITGVATDKASPSNSGAVTITVYK